MKYPVSVPGIGLVGGKFSDGDPEQGIAASLDSAGHMNAITDELINVISGFGLIPNEFVFNQVYAAIAGRIGTAGGLTFRNALINASFMVNQQAVSGSVTLTAGQYGHDMWKAGAAGCTYTFATVGNITTITIVSGSLVQVVDGFRLLSASYVLSWTGTAQGRIAAGAYSASGITAAVTGGVNTSIEFGVGTVSKPQFEQGVLPSAFDFRGERAERWDCLDYFEVIEQGLNYGTAGYAPGQVFFFFPIRYKKRKRNIPAVSVSFLQTNIQWTVPGVVSVSGTSTSPVTATYTTEDQVSLVQAYAAGGTQSPQFDGRVYVANGAIRIVIDSRL